MKKKNCKIEQEYKKEDVCSLCNNRGYWIDKTGTIRTCLECLKRGRFEQ